MPRPAFMAEIAPVGDPYLLGRWHKDRASPRGYVREVKARLKALLRPRPAARKFLMFGRARSGTTLLAYLLNQTPEIRCDGETLHYAVWRPRDFLADLAASAGRPVYGCKLLSYQLLEVHPGIDPDDFMAGLAEDGVTVVHIRRATFHQAISLSVAQATRQYTRLGGQSVRPARVVLDIEGFRRQLRWNAALLAFEEALLAPRPHLVVDYESDLEDADRQQATADRICNALRASPGPVSAPTKRIIGADYARTISNFDAVLAAAAAEGVATPALARRQASTST